MRKLVLAVMTIGALLVGACGDDDGGTTAAPTTAAPTTADGVDVTTTEAGAGGPSEGGDNAECEALASDAAQAQGERSFPDNPDNVWNVAGVTSDEGGWTYVDVVPQPDDVGYPRFQFVSECRGGEVVLLGAYAAEGGGWVLLFTTDEADVDDFELNLD